MPVQRTRGPRPSRDLHQTAIPRSPMPHRVRPRSGADLRGEYSMKLAATALAFGLATVSMAALSGAAQAQADHWRGRDVPCADLYQMGRTGEAGHRHRTELPGHRFRRRAEPDPAAHSGFRRIRRADGPGQARLRQAAAVPDGDGIGGRDRQHPRRQRQPAQAAGRTAGRDLPGQDHQVERPEAGRGQSRP